MAWRQLYADYLTFFAVCLLGGPARNSSENFQRRKIVRSLSGPRDSQVFLRSSRYV